MTADQIFLVKLRKTREKTVTMTADDADAAMAQAADRFSDWDVVEATEDDR